jgi:hypothetical protein
MDMRILSEDLKRRGNVQDLDIDGMSLLKGDFRKYE